MVLVSARGLVVERCVNSSCKRGTLELHARDGTERSVVCLRGSGPLIRPLAVISPILWRNVPGTTSLLPPKPLKKITFVFFYALLLIYIYLLYFSLVLPVFFLFVFFSSPAADCCPSNLCSRLGTFYLYAFSLLSPFLLVLGSTCVSSPSFSALPHQAWGPAAVLVGRVREVGGATLGSRLATGKSSCDSHWLLGTLSICGTVI